MVALGCKMHRNKTKWDVNIPVRLRQPITDAEHAWESREINITRASLTILILNGYEPLFRFSSVSNNFYVEQRESRRNRTALKWDHLFDVISGK